MLCFIGVPFHSCFPGRPLSTRLPCQEGTVPAPANPTPPWIAHTHTHPQHLEDFWKARVSRALGVGLLCSETGVYSLEVQFRISHTQLKQSKSRADRTLRPPLFTRRSSGTREFLPRLLNPCRLAAKEVQRGKCSCCVALSESLNFSGPQFPPHKMLTAKSTSMDSVGPIGMFSKSSGHRWTWALPGLAWPVVPSHPLGLNPEAEMAQKQHLGAADLPETGSASLQINFFGGQGGRISYI